MTGRRRALRWVCGAFRIYVKLQRYHVHGDQLPQKLSMSVRMTMCCSGTKLRSYINGGLMIARSDRECQRRTPSTSLGICQRS